MHLVALFCVASIIPIALTVWSALEFRPQRRRALREIAPGVFLIRRGRP